TRQVENGIIIEVSGGPHLFVPSPHPVGSEVTVALRPEAVTIEPFAEGSGSVAPNATAALIEHVIYHGFATYLHLRLPNGEPMVALSQNRGAAEQDLLRAGMQ